eukprot:4606793-Pyramimonas_sp.AAC.3
MSPPPSAGAQPPLSCTECSAKKGWETYTLLIAKYSKGARNNSKRVQLELSTIRNERRVPLGANAGAPPILGGGRSPHRASPRGAVDRVAHRKSCEVGEGGRQGSRGPSSRSSFGSQPGR